MDPKMHFLFNHTTSARRQQSIVAVCFFNSVFEITILCVVIEITRGKFK